MPRPFGLFDIAKRCPYISYRDIFTGTGCLSVFQMGFEALAEGGGEVGAGLGAGVEAGHGGEGVGFGDAGLGVEDALVEDVAAVADVADGGADLQGFAEEGGGEEVDVEVDDDRADAFGVVRLVGDGVEEHGLAQVKVLQHESIVDMPEHVIIGEAGLYVYRKHWRVVEWL